LVPIRRAKFPHTKRLEVYLSQLFELIIQESLFITSSS